MKILLPLLLLAAACGDHKEAAQRKTPKAIAAESGLAALAYPGWRTVGEDHESRDGGVDVYVLRGDKPLDRMPGSVAIPADAAMQSIRTLAGSEAVGKASIATADSAGWNNAAGEWTATQVTTDTGAWLWLQRMLKK